MYSAIEENIVLTYDLPTSHVVKTSNVQSRKMWKEVLMYDLSPCHVVVAIVMYSDVEGSLEVKVQGF